MTIERWFILALIIAYFVSVLLCFTYSYKLNRERESSRYHEKCTDYCYSILYDILGSFDVEGKPSEFKYLITPEKVAQKGYYKEQKEVS